MPCTPTTRNRSRAIGVAHRSSCHVRHVIRMARGCISSVSFAGGPQRFLGIHPPRWTPRSVRGDHVARTKAAHHPSLAPAAVCSAALMAPTEDVLMTITRYDMLHPLIVLHPHQHRCRSWRAAWVPEHVWDCQSWHYQYREWRRCPLHPQSRDAWWYRVHATPAGWVWRMRVRCRWLRRTMHQLRSDAND
jgi:hypothetical protein